MTIKSTFWEVASRVIASSGRLLLMTVKSQSRRTASADPGSETNECSMARFIPVRIASTVSSPDDDPSLHVKTESLAPYERAINIA
jgi:hypothetical protein